MLQIFSPNSTFKKKAFFLALLWTIMIFIGCLMPAKEIPKVDAPFIDKWVHLVMFGGFTFLWLLAKIPAKAAGLFLILCLGIALGGTIELLQGSLPSLGRACELLDVVADSIGALLGVLLFMTGRALSAKP